MEKHKHLLQEDKLDFEIQLIILIKIKNQYEKQKAGKDEGKRT
jgi:hypothetical protein